MADMAIRNFIESIRVGRVEGDYITLLSMEGLFWKRQ
jgi:hypothetical protein